jgi:hypothetical protein
LEQLGAVLGGCVGVGRSVAVTGNIVHTVLLLTARIWLSQAIFVHQIMMMMRAESFAKAPATGSR